MNLIVPLQLTRKKTESVNAPVYDNQCIIIVGTEKVESGVDHTKSSYNNYLAICDGVLTLIHENDFNSIVEFYHATLVL